MDRIEKALGKLAGEEREKLKEVLIKIKLGDFRNFDLKKLKGRENVFRARKGKMRIIFSKQEDIIKIIALEKRSDTTYKKN